MADLSNLRERILEIIAEHDKQNQNNLQSTGVLQDLQRKLGYLNATEQRQVLSEWGGLFRNGYLSWGLDFCNPDPPFFHITEKGRLSLTNLSRDPANPDGYLAYLTSITILEAVPASYMEEAVKCFNEGLNKAAAVMTGAAAESMVLNLRDDLVNKLKTQGSTVPSSLSDWKIKKVLDEIETIFNRQKLEKTDKRLADEYSARWTPFTLLIRSVRNDAGHPTSIDPITHQDVHASLLMLPELALLIQKLRSWVGQNNIS